MFVFLLLAMLGQGMAQPRSIYLLAGQSNMSGRGGIVYNKWNKIVPPECSPNPSVFRFTANQTWEEAREPLHVDIDSNQTCGVGPGMPFATTLLQLKPSSETIGLVPCAIGGTPLSAWEKGQDLYNHLIQRALASTRAGGVVRALLWYQGENDSNDLESALSYGKRFGKFVNDVRADLFSPNLPVIQVALASGSTYVNLVREAQLGLRLPNLTCVDALGLKLESDHIHLTTESQVILGVKMAHAFLSQQY